MTVPPRCWIWSAFPTRDGGCRNIPISSPVARASALACRPDILIADEPTTALDVTIQAQILRLLRQLQRELATSVVLITHNLAVIAESVERVVVMYAGRKVEEAPVSQLFRRPRHPYTVGLLGSVPSIERGAPRPKTRLAEIS